MLVIRNSFPPGFLFSGLFVRRGVCFSWCFFFLWGLWSPGPGCLLAKGLLPLLYCTALCTYTEIIAVSRVICDVLAQFLPDGKILADNLLRHAMMGGGQVRSTQALNQAAARRQDLRQSGPPGDYCMNLAVRMVGTSPSTME